VLGTPHQAWPHKKVFGGAPKEATLEPPHGTLVRLENVEKGDKENTSKFSKDSKKPKESHPENLQDSSPTLESKLPQTPVTTPVASYDPGASYDPVASYDQGASYDPGASQQPWSLLPRGSNKERGVVDVGRMPGTHWCGKGWRADSAVEMGGYTGADRCCRHHDLGCPLSLEPGSTRWGLTNVRPHTVMHCSCDERFRNCLKLARTQSADIVGNLFFNVINIPCFVFSQERVCTERSWWGRCAREEDRPGAVWRRPIHYWN